MGVGTPDDLLQAVARGIDMFDCVLPTRNGRHGMAFTRLGAINLANARHANDARPLDEQSAHPAARTYSRAYLHHLTKANEMLGQVLLSTINLAYYQALMAGMREAIAAGRFADFQAATKAGWEQGDSRFTAFRGRQRREPDPTCAADYAIGPLASLASRNDRLGIVSPDPLG